MRGVSKGAQSTYAIIDFRATDPSHVPDERGELLWPAKQHQRLVDKMGAQIISLASCRQHFVFPGALQTFAISVKTEI